MEPTTPHADHLHDVERKQRALLNSTRDWRDFRDVLNVSLDVTFDLATCTSHCRGGDHTIEYLLGRGYNLGAAGVALINLGLYDEALSLVRQLGEIVNLLGLFGAVPGQFQNWVSCSRSERLKKFSPAAVRAALDRVPDLRPPLDQDWYRALCESAAHVTPETSPNPHNASQTPKVGGDIGDTDGRLMATSHLAGVMHWLALLAASMIGNPDQLSRVKAADPSMT